MNKRAISDAMLLQDHPATLPQISSGQTESLSSKKKVSLPKNLRFELACPFHKQEQKQQDFFASLTRNAKKVNLFDSTFVPEPCDSFLPPISEPEQGKSNDSNSDQDVQEQEQSQAEPTGQKQPLKSYETLFKGQLQKFKNGSLKACLIENCDVLVGRTGESHFMAILTGKTGIPLYQTVMDPRITQLEQNGRFMAMGAVTSQDGVVSRCRWRLAFSDEHQASALIKSLPQSYCSLDQE